MYRRQSKRKSRHIAAGASIGIRRKISVRKNIPLKLRSVQDPQILARGSHVNNSLWCPISKRVKKRIRHIWALRKEDRRGTAVDLLGKIRKLSKMVAHGRSWRSFQIAVRRNSKSTSWSMTAAKRGG